MKAGLIGTGNIGNPMTGKLIRAGGLPAANDLRKGAAIHLREMGARWAGRRPAVRDLRERAAILPREVGAQRAGSPNRAVLGNEAVFVSFPVPPDAGAVVLGERGILASAADGTVYVHFSTNSPTDVRRHQQVCGEKGPTVVETPVGCGKPPLLLRVCPFVWAAPHTV